MLKLNDDCLAWVKTAIQLDIIKKKKHIIFTVVDSSSLSIYWSEILAYNHPDHKD